MNEHITGALQAVNELREAQTSAAHIVRATLGSQLRHWSTDDWEQVPELVRDTEELDRAISNVLDDLGKLRNSVRGFLSILKAMEQTSGELNEEPLEPDEAAEITMGEETGDRATEAAPAPAPTRTSTRTRTSGRNP